MYALRCLFLCQATAGVLSLVPRQQLALLTSTIASLGPPGYPHSA